MHRNIYIVITTFNGEDTLRCCLDSLRKCSQLVKTVIIDNASTDHTVEIIRSFPDVIFFPQEKNLGFGRANNIGMKYALENGADQVLLLNQDAWINEETIQILSDFASANPEFGIVSPLHLNADGTEIDNKVVMYLTKDQNDYVSDLYLGSVKTSYEVKFINAACWLLSRKCIESVGGFDDLFFIYGEDDDYCHRARKKGFKVGIIPQAVIYHARTGRRERKSAWENMLLQASYQSALIMARLKKTDRPFLSSIIFWRIDHLARKLELLFKGHLSDLIVTLLAGTIILMKLPKIWLHKRESEMTPAFWVTK